MSSTRVIGPQSFVTAELVVGGSIKGRLQSFLHNNIMLAGPPLDLLLHMT